MRQWEKISSQRVALYHLRIQNGRYLRDIPLDNLSDIEQDDLKRCARVLVTKTRLEVRRVKRGRRRVWRFVDVGKVY